MKSMLQENKVTIALVAVGVGLTGTFGFYPALAIMGLPFVAWYAYKEIRK